MSDKERYDKLREQVDRTLVAFHNTFRTNPLGPEWQKFWGELNALELMI